MTMEEVSELRKQEKAKTLRKPISFKEDMTNVEKSILQQKIIIAGALIRLTQRKGIAQNFLPTSLVSKSIIRSSFLIKSFKGLGTRKRPYKIDGELGKGKIVNAHEFFIKNKYPKFVEKGHCFGNCHTMAELLARDNIEAKVISGIFYNGDHSFLHSVLEVENKYIIDFNIDFAISKEMYSKLFLFETLAVLDGKQIHKDKEFVDQNIKSLKGMSIMYVNFAYDDVINYLKNKERQQQDLNLEK